MRFLRCINAMVVAIMRMSYVAGVSISFFIAAPTPASASNFYACQSSLLVSATKPLRRSPIRDSFLALQSEMEMAKRAEVASGDLQPPSDQRDQLRWPFHYPFYSPYILKNLSRSRLALADSFEAASREAIHPRVIRSVETVLAELENVISQFPKKGIVYNGFLKLSYLAALQRDFLITERNFGGNLFRKYTGTNRYPPVKTDTLRRSLGGIPFATPIIGAASDIDAFTKSKFVPFISGTPENVGWDQTINFDFNLGLYVPTFAKLGFETILWGMARGIFPLGQSDTNQLPEVDGSRMSHQIYFAHDVLHGSATPLSPGIEQASSFWDAFSATVFASATGDRMRAVMLTILFDIFHERSSEMSCSGVAKYFHPPGVEISLENLGYRIKQKDDLGQAFAPNFPSETEFSNAVEKVKLAHKAFCPSLIE